MSQWESLPPATQALLNAHGGQRGTYVHASVVRALKGHAGAALFLSQLLYWSARATLEDGWFYNTREEYEAQIGMGKGAQRTAQNLLVGLGLLRVERRGVPPKNHYRVDLQAVHDLLASTAMQDQETLSTTQNHQTSTIL